MFRCHLFPREPGPYTTTEGGTLRASMKAAAEFHALSTRGALAMGIIQQMLGTLGSQAEPDSAGDATPETFWKSVVMEANATYNVGQN